LPKRISVNSVHDAVFDGAVRPAASRPLRYIVMGSRTLEVWNLGGDLEFFAERIRNPIARHSPATPIFAAISPSPTPPFSICRWSASRWCRATRWAAASRLLIVAERSAKFAFPEVLSTSSQGLGAYTFLSRRIAPGLPERMILSGEVYSAEDLYKLGAIDVLAPDGAASKPSTRISAEGGGGTPAIPRSGRPAASPTR
jgi:DSF synthase